MFHFVSPGRAYDFGNDAYQEMKAEVTEVAASRLIPEGNHNFTGTCWVLLMPMAYSGGMLLQLNVIRCKYITNFNSFLFSRLWRAAVSGRSCDAQEG